MWKNMVRKIRERADGTPALVNQVFDRAVRETAVALDSETARQVKDATRTAAATARRVGLYLTDINGDGKVDAEDIRLAAEKAGLAWDRIDPDLKAALLAGGAAGIGVNFIPIVGQAIAVPAFAGTAAYVYLVAKLRGIGRK